MYEVVQKKKIADHTFLIQVKAPQIARKARPGQFVMIRADENAARVAATLAGWDRSSISIVLSESDSAMRKLARLKKGNVIKDIAGPLGNPMQKLKEATVCLVADGMGIAGMLPILRECKKARNKTITVIGAKSSDFLFFEREVMKLSDQMHVCTEDGSKGEKGRVTEPFFRIMRKRVDVVVAIGSLAMMKEICRLSRHRARAYVSIGINMIDGLGMCGGCRLTYDGKTRLSCVDGLLFDGQLVDWDELINRSRAYEGEEKHLCGLR